MLERYCGFKMILNLNEPSKLEDTSWIKPMNMLDFGGNARREIYWD
jgi:hypothetical protein